VPELWGERPRVNGDNMTPLLTPTPGNTSRGQLLYACIEHC
jgi:hypothetical protein